VPKSDQDADAHASVHVQNDPEEPSSKMTDRKALRLALEALASPSSPAYSTDEADATGPPDQAPPEASERQTDINSSLEILTEQMLSLVDVVSIQKRDIAALKARCQQLEDHEQAIMVAFTTFFHVLAAGKVAKLEDVATILHNIISVAQHEAYPQESIRFLQSLATMLHGQLVATGVETRDPLRSGSGDV
jgi:hypothetical protein